LKKLALFVLFLFLSIHLFSQDIASHQWQDRVLIVIANEKSNELLQKQIAIFKENNLGIEERKLKIYLATPNEYSTFNTSGLDWSPGKTLYKNYKLKDSEIELVLIGLDGQIKHRKYSLTPALEIFVIIDGMPMRQSELKKG
jgi:hypothetical protein